MEATQCRHVCPRAAPSVITYRTTRLRPGRRNINGWERVSNKRSIVNFISLGLKSHVPTFIRFALRSSDELCRLSFQAFQTELGFPFLLSLLGLCLAAETFSPRGIGPVIDFPFYLRLVCDVFPFRSPSLRLSENNRYNVM